MKPKTRARAYLIILFETVGLEQAIKMLDDSAAREILARLVHAMPSQNEAAEFKKPLQ